MSLASTASFAGPHNSTRLRPGTYLRFSFAKKAHAAKQLISVTTPVQNSSMYSASADVILGLHLLFILWIVFGATVTRRRPVLQWLHLGSLVWGILIEILPWTCPLTWAENWLEARAGVAPYQGGFLLHYLDALVYPNIPPSLLTGCGIGICIINLSIHVVRFQRRRLAGG